MPSSTASRNGTREQVLNHAAALIRERGFRATSIGDLLERAGVQKGSFYYYFPSKEDLGHAVLDRWIEELRARLIDYLAAAEGPPPLERIAAALDGFVSEQESTGCRGGCPFGNLAMELADVHEGFRTRISGALKELSAAFARLVERARADGDLRPDTDPHQIGEFLVAAIEGGILLAKVHKSPEALEAALRAAEAYVASHRTRAE
ncbi:MAG TPA: TetR/AcrR family transcriptional regulator [Planctomycetota bacterium]|jgi:TetR/AcrR family transcriptional repressor of nem operon|nr:TetR/AcrR family transcriptional regulator [Planctomycetota bacterium]